MYVTPRDSEILRSEEMYALKKRYREKFGEGFIPFNYVDFQGTEDVAAAYFYLETLRKAVEATEPFHLVSHRYDFFDH